MATFTIEEDMFFAEVCPITIYRDGEPVLAVAGELGPADGATDKDRAFAEEVRRTLAVHADMLAALKDLAAIVDATAWGQPWPGRPHAQMDAARAAIAKAEGRS